MTSESTFLAVGEFWVCRAAVGVMVWEPRERVAVLKVGESWCVILDSVLLS